ncbi:PLP-dependent aminotransferase family protein [Marinomonas agarivorans]|nr:PLP-dependent aminotransferase family protein [Marinomonas agarivorans]
MNPIFEINIQLPTKKSGDTLVDSISRQLKENIENGSLPADTRLPPSRKFASQFTISRNTVLHIYDNLINEGYLYTKQGGGTYVKAPRAKKAIKPPPADYKTKLVASWQQHDLCSILLNQTQREFDFSVGKSDTSYFRFDLMRKYLAQSTHVHSKHREIDTLAKGYPPLRQVLVNHLAISRAIVCAEEDLILTNGAQQALDLIAKVLIKADQTKVVIEQPGYPMAEILFRAHGAIVVPVAVDENGLMVDDIPDDTDIIYVTPSHQFPLGMSMTQERRRSLMALADQQDMLIIEDDYDSEFRLTDDPVETLYAHAKKDNVFLVGTFSKSLIPDVHTGFIVAPEWASDALQKAKFVTDRYQHIIRQQAMHLLIEQGLMLKYLSKMRQVYQDRYQALLTACQKHSDGLIQPIPIKAGIHVTANLPEHIDAKQVAKAAAAQQVSILSVQDICPRATDHNALVFGLGRIEAHVIETGIERIMAVMSDAL